MTERKKPVPAPASAKRKPGSKERAAMAKAASDFERRPARVSVRYDHQPDGRIQLTAPHDEEDAHATQILSALGTTSSSFMAENLAMLEVATRAPGQPHGENVQCLNAAFALIEAIGPQDELEGALALQMASCHAASMNMLGCARHAVRPDMVAMYSSLAVKMQRTFTAQVEALARLRGKGQQTVRVEHVNVYPGAQAVVGDVHHHPRGSGGAQSETEELQYGSGDTAPGTQGRKALPGPDSSRDSVPVASDAQRPVQDSRRPVTRRRARRVDRATGHAAVSARSGPPHTPGEAECLKSAKITRSWSLLAMGTGITEAS